MDTYTNKTLYSVGDLVSFTGYNYTPDYMYVDGDDYSLGIVIRIVRSIVYRPTYKVFWFKKGYATETIQEHLRLVVKKTID